MSGGLPFIPKTNLLLPGVADDDGLEFSLALFF